jgi:hypothetical protein
MARRSRTLSIAACNRPGYDADDDGFSEPRADGRWGWRADAVASFLAQIPSMVVSLQTNC